jgi:hypothetical protein
VALASSEVRLAVLNPELREGRKEGATGRATAEEARGSELVSANMASTSSMAALVWAVGDGKLLRGTEAAVGAAVRRRNALRSSGLREAEEEEVEVAGDAATAGERMVAMADSLDRPFLCGAAAAGAALLLLRVACC